MTIYSSKIRVENFFLEINFFKVTISAIYGRLQLSRPPFHYCACDAHKFKLRRRFSIFHDRAICRLSMLVVTTYIRWTIPKWKKELLQILNTTFNSNWPVQNTIKTAPIVSKQTKHHQRHSCKKITSTRSCIKSIYSTCQIVHPYDKSTADYL